jgi:hypothetical protein
LADAPPEDLGGLPDQELQERVTRLEREAIPVRAQLDAIRAEIDIVRTELRRRERAAQLAHRRATRAELAGGVTLEDLVAGGAELPVTALDQLTFLRESATEVRLGYASAARQSISFTDGTAVEEASDLLAAAALWARGWDFGTPAARGVRVYPVGSRAERVVPAGEVHARPR